MRSILACFLGFNVLWAQQPQPAQQQQQQPPAQQPKPATEGGAAYQFGRPQGTDQERKGPQGPQAPKPAAPVPVPAGQAAPPAAPNAQQAKPAPDAQATPPATPPPAQTATPAQTSPTGNLSLNNASLVDVIDELCKRLRINYILDPRVKGSVTLNTYGETKSLDARTLLDLLLRINGFTMVQVGEIYRIVPLAEANRMPFPPVSADAKDIPLDEQTMLNLVFLKYAAVAEVQKLVEPFIGEGAKVYSYAPANLLFLLDSRRNIRRTMEVIAMFDSDTLASQRVRLFEVKNGSPGAIVKELEEILRGISLTNNNSVRFLPVDRINTIIAVAPNPGAFEEVEKWIAKLDVENKVTAGAVDNFVYRVKYGRAEVLAMAIMSLYMGGGFGMMGMMGMGGMMGGMGGMMGGMGGMMGGYPGGMMGGYPGGMMGGYPGGMMGGYPGGMMGGYGGMMGMAGYQGGYGPGLIPGMAPGMGYAPQYPTAPAAANTQGGASGGGSRTTTGDQTGTFLSGSQQGPPANMPRIIPNPMDNTLLIQATPAEYQQILKLLRDLDIAPRQVLIDAKIYEVSLTGAFASGVSAVLQQRRDSIPSGLSRELVGTLGGGGVLLTAGMLVGESRYLLGLLSLQENATKAKVLSSPSVIATDNLAASISVGLDVPTLTATSVTPIQSGGNSLFANTIQSRSTGVNLQVTARVNPSGIVTLVINQEVSAPQPPPPGGQIQSPSFSRRSVNTQVTVQDGDTIAIAGIINESSGSSSSGIPMLHKIPILGAAFGNRSYNHDRTELIIFMTPRVIYDTNQIQEASDELRSRLRKLAKMVKD